MAKISRSRRWLLVATVTAGGMVVIWLARNAALREAVITAILLMLGVAAVLLQNSLQTGWPFKKGRKDPPG